VGLPARARKTIKRLALGPDDLPQQCILGLRDPQQQIAVELHGLGAPRDVTHNHTLACASPFTVCISFDRDLQQDLKTVGPLSLHFRERNGPRKLLGKLTLRLSANLPLDKQQDWCFTISRSSNYCLPQIRLWARYLHWAYLRWRRPPDVRLASKDIAAMPIFFICPRPVALVSVGDNITGNIFPMNLMGPLGEGRFGFALNSTRASASLVRGAGRLALSSVPLDKASLARELGKNHRTERARWDQFPFRTRPSPRLGIPVPSFAVRVREMEVLTSCNLGSHIFFVARVLEDEWWTDDLQFFMVHGIYQSWRVRAYPGESSSEFQQAL
jgi:flavin reductase (DIM6/NTAB) family NADH-FMN oxidoreductase RutF